MMSRQIVIQFITDYWDIALVPAGMWFMHWWMKRKFTLIIDDQYSDPSTAQCEKLIQIIATQTKILEKLDADVERLSGVTVSMKEEDTRVRDNFTRCLEKISESTDALVGMFKEYRAYERGRDAAAHA